MINKVKLDDEIIKELINLSKEWQEEDSCFGYRENTIDDIKNEIVYLSTDSSKINGYLFGHYEIVNKESVTVPINSKVFEVEEIYVKKEKRSLGIGKELFNFLEHDIEQDCDYILLSTATKDYKAILHFYIEELDMTFWSARLFKKLK